MQIMEEQALATYKNVLPFWLGYIDDIFTALHVYEIDDFLTLLFLNCFVKLDGTLLFLNCLMKHDNQNLRTTVYRKPTHVDQLLDQATWLYVTQSQHD